MTASKVDGCDPAQGGNDEQNHYLQDQFESTIPTPDCNTFLLKQGELR